MYIHKAELAAIAILYGLIAGLVPWAPKNTFESIVIAFYILVMSIGVVALAEMAYEEITKKDIPG